MYEARVRFVSVTVNEILDRKTRSTVLYEGPWTSWRPCPDGVAIEINGRYYINGQQEISESEWNMLFLPNVRYPIIINNNWIQEKDPKLERYEGEFHAWAFNQNGIVVRRKNKFILIPIDF